MCHVPLDLREVGTKRGDPSLRVDRPWPKNDPLQPLENYGGCLLLHHPLGHARLRWELDHHIAHWGFPSQLARARRSTGNKHLPCLQFYRLIFMLISRNILRSRMIYFRLGQHALRNYWMVTAAVKKGSRVSCYVVKVIIWRIQF